LGLSADFLCMFTTSEDGVTRPVEQAICIRLFIGVRTEVRTPNLMLLWSVIEFVNLACVGAQV